MKERKFTVRAEQRAGIRLAIQWNIYWAKVFRHVIAYRQKDNISYGEALCKAEQYEYCASQLRQLLKRR